MSPHQKWRLVAKCPLAAEGLHHRDTQSLGEGFKLVPGLGIVDTTASYEDRAASVPQQRHSLANSLRISEASLHSPNPLFKETCRVGIGVSLNLLG